MAVEEEAPAQEAETNLPTAQLEAPAEGLQTNAQQQLPLAAAVDTPEQQDQVVATGDTDTTVVNITASVSEPAEAETSTHPTRATPAATSDLQQSVASAEETGTALAEVQADASVPFPALESSGTESDKTVSPDVAADSSGDRVAATPNAVPADQSTGDSANAASAVADAMESPPLGFANTTFTVPTEKWQHQQSVPLATTAAEIKHSLCSNWNIAETALSVKYADQEMQDAESLHSCGIQAGANVEIELVIHYQLLATKRKSEAAPKVANLPEAAIHIVDALGAMELVSMSPQPRIEVTVFQGAESEAKLVTVRVDVTQKQSKRYRGGYRDKRNGALYHHADSQTDKQANDKANTQRYERECQTVATKQRGGQTCREAQVQMARPDLLLDTSRDRFLSPRKYVTADEVWAEKERCAAIIQRFTRGWLARIRVRFMLKEARQGTAAANKAAAEAADQDSALKRFEAQRRLQPCSPADFALLHSELAAWHQAETARIKAAALSPEEAHLAFCHLLHQETRLLQSMDRLKAEADVVAHEQRIAGALASMATPKQWSLSNGGLLDVHTPATIRAAELRGLYRGLQLILGAGERLDVLLHVKCKVKEFDTSLTRELLQLIEREADLINRGRKAGTMEGLRRRISALFLQFIESPAFNPEAANFFNLGPKTCSSETYMYGSMTAADAAGIAVKSLLV